MTARITRLRNPATALLLLAGLAVTAGAALASGAADLSKDTVKKACRAEAEKQGLSTGDFGDTGFNKERGMWVTRLMVHGSAEKFKALCEWSGTGTPKLTVADSGAHIASKKYSKKDVNEACKKQGKSEGLEVGDFGDTQWDKSRNQWVSKMMARRPGEEKRKATCAWNGDRPPVIE
jgi:hypothetical protein